MSKYSDRVQLGLCGSCGNPADGNSRCEKCREKNRVRLKERYNKRKSLGLCVDCGKPADNGCRCAECAKKASEYVSDVHKMRKEVGLCIYCDSPLDENSKQFCTYHKMEKRFQSQSDYGKIKESDEYSEYRKKQTEYQKIRTENRKEQGMCVRCGKRKVYSERSTRMCLQCLFKANKEQRNYRFNKQPFHRSDIIDGVHCKTCCKPVEIQGAKQCNRCREISLLNLEKSREKHPWKKLQYGKNNPVENRWIY